MIKRTRLGELAIIYQLITPPINRQNIKKVHQVYYALKELDLAYYGILDIVPSYSDITIHLAITSPLLGDDSFIMELIKSVMANCDSSVAKAKTHLIPVCYDGEDLDDVLIHHNISRSELIKLHSEPEYLIAMLGFRPYFPYLLGLNSKLHLPRRSTPRLMVRAGTIAIGGEQTGIYTNTSPAGWHIIGHTEFTDFASFRCGDTIKFSNVENK